MFMQSPNPWPVVVCERYEPGAASPILACYAFCCKEKRSSAGQSFMKQQRHTAIRDVLSHASVPSQDELRRKLARRGFHVTQATLSRDIHELRLSKGPAGYALPGNPVEEDGD